MDWSEGLSRQVRAQLRTDARIVIITHERPDADAFGSAFGVAHYAASFGCRPTVISPTVYPGFLSWFPGLSDWLLVAEPDATAAREALANADFVVATDFGVADRAGACVDALRQTAAPKLHIDHHLDFEPFAGFVFRDPTASSSAELVYRFIQALGDTERIETNIANCLFAGLLTDTGSFKQPNTTVEAYRMAADLMGRGLQRDFVVERLFQDYTETRLRLVGFALTERMRLTADGRAAVIHLNADDHARFDVQPGDTEGIVNYPLTIGGVRLSVLVLETEDRIKLSFRSVGDFPAREVAQRFEGGGHFHAAGGRSADTLENTLARLDSLLNGDFLPALTAPQQPAY